MPKGSGTSFFSFQYFVFFFSFLTLTIYNSLLKLNLSSLQIPPKTTPQASTSEEHQSYVSKRLADITMSMLPTPNSPCPKLPSPSPPASLPPNNVPLPSCPISLKNQLLLMHHSITQSQNYSLFTQVIPLHRSLFQHSHWFHAASAFITCPGKLQWAPKEFPLSTAFHLLVSD